MANFNTHITVGATASALLSGVLLSMKIVEPTQAVILFGIGTFGTLLPDIDSKNSKAIRVGFTVISLFVAIIAVLFKSATYSLMEIIIMGSMIFIGIRFGLITIFREASVHRGMFHSIPVALIWGLSLTIISYSHFKLDILISWIYGITLTWGYIIHLILDEIYSVDLHNSRIKKSFGTAFKFFRLKTELNRVQNVIIYMVLVYLLYIAPNSTILQDTFYREETWVQFKDILIPNDGVWFLN